MKAILTLLLAAWAATFAFGQNDVMTNDTKDRLNSSALGMGPGSLIYGFDSKRGEVLGDYYFDSNWQEGRAVLYPLGSRTKLDTVARVQMRLDVHNNELEFRTTFGVKALPGSEVKWLEFRDKGGAVVATFLNMKELGQTERGLLLQLLSEGKLKLVLEHKIWMKMPTYNPALDMGSRDTEIRKVKTWYYLKGEKLEKFKPTRGNLLKVMRSKEKQMETFLKANPVDADAPATVKAAFDYYNGL